MRPAQEPIGGAVYEDQRTELPERAAEVVSLPVPARSPFVSFRRPRRVLWTPMDTVYKAIPDFLAVAGTGGDRSPVTEAWLPLQKAVLDRVAHWDTSLEVSLSGLGQIEAVALAEDLPSPPRSAISNARLLLPKLHRILPGRYDVYPTEQGGVAITPPMRDGASASIECHDNDVVYCFASIDGNRRRAKFYQMDGLPDPFIVRVLRDVAHR